VLTVSVATAVMKLEVAQAPATAAIACAIWDPNPQPGSSVSVSEIRFGWGWGYAGSMKWARLHIMNGASSSQDAGRQRLLVSPPTENASSSRPTGAAARTPDSTAVKPLSAIVHHPDLDPAGQKVALGLPNADFC